MSPLQKISYALVLIGTSNLAYADLTVPEKSIIPNRLEELQRALAQGSYADTYQDTSLTLTEVEAIEQAAEEATKAAEEATKAVEEILSSYPMIVRPSDYNRAGIKSKYKVFSDSEIWYSPKADEYYEQKHFGNNIKFSKVYGAKGGIIYDINDSDDNDVWTVNCYKDHITDERICGISKYEMMFIKSSKNGWSFTVSKEFEQLRPNQYQYVRIDKSTALKARNLFTGQQVLNVIEQMKKGKTAYTRFYEWSNEYEEIIPLKGFTVAYNTMNAMYSKL